MHRARPDILYTDWFTSIYYDTANPYDKEHGHNCVKKEGSRLTFFWQGSYRTVVIPELQNVECRKLQISISQYGARGLTDRYVKRNCFRDLSFEKMHVEKWKDVPNRYQPGDVVLIDGAAAKVYVNGLPRMADEIVGSKYFRVPPGETKVQFYFSDFCEIPPTVQARIREVYL